MSRRRRYAILASGAFAGRAAKTAHGVIAYGNDEVVAVIDAEYAGKRVRDVVPALNSSLPVKLPALSAAWTLAFCNTGV